MDESSFINFKKEVDTQDVLLVAVSKTKPIEAMMQVYDWGQLDFGENRIEEINRKAPLCPQEFNWHLIGPLQSKKIKLLGKNIALFHAVDRNKILHGIQEHFESIDHVQDILLQVHIAEEDTKHGYAKAELIHLFESGILRNLANIRVRGLMGMATFTDNQEQVRSEFEQLNDLFEIIKKEYASTLPHFDILSMGMSGDYEAAIKAGSSLIRVGSKIFGARN